MIAVATHGHFDHVGRARGVRGPPLSRGRRRRRPRAVSRCASSASASPTASRRCSPTTASRCPSARSTAVPYEGFDAAGWAVTGCRADVVRRRRRRDRSRRPARRGAARARPHAGVDRAVGAGHRAAVQRRHGLRRRRGSASTTRRGPEASLRPARRVARDAGARGARPQLRRRRARVCCSTRLLRNGGHSGRV